MKTILFIAALLFLSCGSETEAGFDSKATANATKTFKVWGNCDMCKKTIEGSLKTDGMVSADWNTETKMMAISFDSTKISTDQVHQRIAAAGYDTEKYTGDDQAYENLHKCCKYERKK